MVKKKMSRTVRTLIGSLIRKAGVRPANERSDGPRSEGPPPVAAGTSIAEMAPPVDAPALAAHADPGGPTSGEIPPETIAARAYEIWVENGRPEGTAERDWLQADRELRPRSG